MTGGSFLWPSAEVIPTSAGSIAVTRPVLIRAEDFAVLLRWDEDDIIQDKNKQRHKT